MILIFVLCLKLSILHLCVSDLGYQCTTDDSSYKPEIFLIEDDIEIEYDINRKHQLTDLQRRLNSDFFELCKDYYNIVLVPSEGPGEHDNVIHLAVPHYYDGKPLENFVYAGNISKIDETVCTKINKDEPDEPANYDCNEIVNLVSEPVLELHGGHVYDLVQKMSITEIGVGKSCEPFFPKTSDLNLVLLCLPERYYSKQVNIHPLQLIQLTESECRGYLNEMGLNPNKNRLLAVLAPEPFKVPSEYSVPTIFYETSYLLSEAKTAFPNSMSLVPWRLLKYGFLKFIQAVGWQRVAIVSDDSEYSLDFEDELTALFSKERMMYTVIRCEDANCDMDKIVQELSRVSARVVIANVEEKHAQYLFRKAHHKITWLVRDMVGDRHDKHLTNYRVAYSFSLSIDTCNTKGCNVEDNILTGLSSIAQAYKNIAEEDYKVNKREFYRRFADKAKHVTPRITKATIVVRKIYSLQEVSTMSVNATGAEMIHFNHPFKSGTPSDDGTAECLVTSYNYQKPCEDPLVIFLMLILMLFMLTFITITCYFDKTSPFHDIRYQNF